MIGHFHSHLTLGQVTAEQAERARRLSRGKLTTILLEKGGTQTKDFMVTCHYMAGPEYWNKDSRDVLDALLCTVALIRSEGIPVLRTKLEWDFQEDENPYDHSPIHYVEVHAKYVVHERQLPLLKALGTGMGWRASSNPFQRKGDLVTQFLNCRFYNGEYDRRSVDAFLSALSILFAPKEVKHEAAIYDSHEAHDAWWAL